jgi:hypothetical protein
MPRHAKSTKYARDTRMMEGLIKHAALLNFGPPGLVESPLALAARFREHLDAMRAVERREAAWRDALRREAKIEAGIKDLMARLARLLSGVLGVDAPVLRDFGLKPATKPKVSVETKRRAVEKRAATRRLRGTMGRRQRKKVKGSP